MNKQEVAELLKKFNEQVNITSGGLGLGEQSLEKWINENVLDKYQATPDTPKFVLCEVTLYSSVDMKKSVLRYQPDQAATAKTILDNMASSF